MQFLLTSSDRSLDLFGVRRLPGNRIGVGKYDFPGAVCLFIQVQLPGAASGGQRNLPSSQPADPEMAMELAKKSQPVIPTRASWKKDPKQYGNDFHKMVVTNQPKGKYGGGWELWKQNETVGGTSRPDEVWINRDENRLLIVDNYTGGKRDVLTPSGPESNAHFEKGLAYCYEPEILELVRQLPPATQAVFNLFVIEGYSHNEIGQMMNISDGTSKWHLNEARKKLQNMITNQRINS